MTKIKTSEITPEHVYLSRREFMKGSAAAALGALALAACGISTPTPAEPTSPPGDTPAAGATLEPTATSGAPSAGGGSDELGDPLTSYEAVTQYNNFYEFTTNKEGVASLAEDFITSPWQVEVSGLVENPRSYTTEDLLQFEQEERIYRMRCVEGWSMVIPWIGFPLWRILDEVVPTAEAQYVRFETIHDPEQMPGQKSRAFVWPYVEGLRMDEARHDMTLMATGLYGKHLLPQNGSPLRLVVPWKYGFKSIKSIVKIELVKFRPISLWMEAAPHEYGFYANVNPEVDHPRWSQASERRIGESGRRPTLMFNGYEDEVAYLYEGMDLAKDY